MGNDKQSHYETLLLQGPSAIRVRVHKVLCAALQNTSYGGGKETAKDPIAPEFFYICRITTIPCLWKNINIRTTIQQINSISANTRINYL